MPFTNNNLFPNFVDPVVTNDIGTNAAMPGDPGSYWSRAVSRAATWMRSARDWIAGLGLRPLKP